MCRLLLYIPLQRRLRVMMTMMTTTATAMVMMIGSPAGEGVRSFRGKGGGGWEPRHGT